MNGLGASLNGNVNDVVRMLEFVAVLALWGLVVVLVAALIDVFRAAER